MFDSIAKILGHLQSFPIDWRDAALVSAVVVSWMAILLVLVAMRRTQRQAKLTLEWYQQLSHDLQIASGAAVGMGQRILLLERKLSAHRTVAATDTQTAAAAPVMQSHATPLPVKQTQAVKQQASQIANILTSNTSTSTPSTKTISAKTLSAKPEDDAKKPSPPPKPSLAVVTGDAAQPGLVALKTEYPPPPHPRAQQAPVQQQPPVQPKQGKKAATSAQIPAPAPFEQAQKLLLAGIDVDEVAKRCGLTPSEAQLMQLVLRQQSQQSLQQPPKQQTPKPGQQRGLAAG